MFSFFLEFLTADLIKTKDYYLMVYVIKYQKDLNLFIDEKDFEKKNSS